MGDFGAPVYEAEIAGAAGTVSGAPGEAVQEVIDQNDPRLVSESLDVNVDGDAYAQPAPPPDGKYRVKLKLVQQKAGQDDVDYIVKAHEKNGPYFAASIEATILDASGKYDGVKLYDPWVGTFLNRDKSTKVQTILRLLKQPNGEPWVTASTKLTQKGWMDLFVKALAGEPEIGIETQWEWNCQPCGEEAKKAGGKYPKSIQGMAKFPADAKVKGAFSPELRCQVSPAHMYSKARARIAGFVPLSFVPLSIVK